MKCLTLKFPTVIDIKFVLTLLGRIRIVSYTVYKQGMGYFHFLAVALRGFYHVIPICIELFSPRNVHKFNYFVLLFFVEHVVKVWYFDAIEVSIIVIILQGMTFVNKFNYFVLLFFVERVVKVWHFDAILIAIVIISQGMTPF